jgi:hypothetical protein
MVYFQKIIFSVTEGGRNIATGPEPRGGGVSALPHVLLRRRMLRRGIDSLILNYF